MQQAYTAFPVCRCVNGFGVVGGGLFLGPPKRNQGEGGDGCEGEWLNPQDHPVTRPLGLESPIIENYSTEYVKTRGGEGPNPGKWSTPMERPKSVPDRRNG
jgi:hypothetical protein